MLGILPGADVWASEILEATFVSPTRVELAFQVGYQDWEDPDRWQGELYRDDTFLGSFDYGEHTFADTTLPLTDGTVSYQVKWWDSVAINDSEECPCLRYSPTITVTPSKVEGVLTGDMTWATTYHIYKTVTVADGVKLSVESGARIDRSADNSFSYGVIRLQGTASLSVNGYYANSIEIDDVQFYADDDFMGSVEVRLARFTGLSSSVTAMVFPVVENLSISSCTFDLETTRILDNSRSEFLTFENNSGTCVEGSLVTIGIPMDDYGFYTIRDNNLENCALSMATSYGDPWPAATIVVEDNVLRSLSFFHYSDEPVGAADLSVVGNVINQLSIYGLAGRILVEGNQGGTFWFETDNPLDTLDVDSTGELQYVLQIVDNLDLSGLTLRGYQDVLLEGNSSSDTVYLESVVGALIQDNHIVSPDDTGTTGLGVVTSEDVVIKNNVIEGFYSGLYLTDSASNEVVGNHVVDNMVTLTLRGQVNYNQIYNNEFRTVSYGRNTDVGCDPDGCGDNEWNVEKTAGTNVVGGAFLGGNYWSDYQGSDEDNDGLGDTPYALGAAGSDELPLIRYTVSLDPGPANPRGVPLEDLKSPATVLHLRLTNGDSENEVLVRAISPDFLISGTGGSASAVDLYPDPTCSGQPAGEPTRVAFGNGNTTFDGRTERILPGQSICYLLQLELGDDVCPCVEFAGGIERTSVEVEMDAVPLQVGGQFVSGSRLSPYPTLDTPEGMVFSADSNETTDVSVIAVDTPSSCLDRWEAYYLVCSVPAGASGFGFDGGAQETTVPFDPLDAMATAAFTAGDLRGVYNLCVIPTPDSSQGMYCPEDLPKDLSLDVLVAGIDLEAQFDGDEEETIGTFLQDIEAMNVFTAEALLPPGDSRQVVEMTFDLDGEEQVDRVGPFLAEYDMAERGVDSTLFLTAELSDGTLLQDEYPVFALPLPYWVEGLETVSAVVDRRFDPDYERYEFFVSQYPSDFYWHTEVPDDIPMLGGTSLEGTLSYEMDADFYITEEADFDGRSSMSGEVFQIDYATQGRIHAEFDKEFVLLPGAYARSHSESEFELHRFFSRTPEFAVLDVPIQVDVYFGAGVKLRNDLAATFDQAFHVEHLTSVPRVQGLFYTVMSAYREVGVAYLGVFARACAEVDAKLSYQTGAGEPTLDYFGGAVMFRVGMFGSPFWRDLDSEDLGAASFGPYPFGDGPMNGYGEVSCLVLCGGEGPDLTPRFFPRSSLASDSFGRLMLIRTYNAAGPGESPRPVLAFLLDRGQGFGSETTFADTGRWKMDPALVFLDEGHALAVWTTNDGDPDLSSLNDIFAHQEIAFAFWNGDGWSDVGLVTDDEEADGAAALAYDPQTNTVLAVWVHNANTSADLADRTRWSLRYARFNPVDGTWTVPEVVPGTGEGTFDTEPTVVSDDHGHFIVAWSRDEDGVLYEEGQVVQDLTEITPRSTDSDVVFSVFDGLDWSPVVSFSEENEAIDFHPALSRRPDNDISAVWVSREAGQDHLHITRIHAADWTPDPPTRLDSADYLIEDPRVVVDSTGLATVIYRKNNGRDDEIYGLEVDLAEVDLVPGVDEKVSSDWTPRRLTHERGAAWSPVVAVTSDDEVVVSWSQVLEDTQPAGGMGDLLQSGVRLARLRADARARFDGSRSVRLTEDDSGRIERLEVDVGLEVLDAGAFSLAASLEDQRGRVIDRATSEPQDLPEGPGVLTLVFSGREISEAAEDGPYHIADLVVLDHEWSPVVIDQDEVGFDTDPLEVGNFIPARLASDRTIFSGEEDVLRLAVTDESREGSVLVSLVSSAVGEPVEIDLPETGPGLFERDLHFSTEEEGEDTIKVEPAGVLDFRYEDGEDEEWRLSVAWLPEVLAPHSLEVDVSPRGAGRVLGDGIDCPRDCYQTVLVGGVVHLEAEPESGYELESWDSDACSGSQDCTFFMSQDTTVHARFRKVGSVVATPTPTPSLETPTPGVASPSPGPTGSPETTPGGEPEEEGCGCRSTDRGERNGGISLAMLVLAGLVRTGRRRRSGVLSPVAGKAPDHSGQ